jgi:hypothetical protein
MEARTLFWDVIPVRQKASIAEVEIIGLESKAGKRRPHFENHSLHKFLQGS